jgi:Fe-S cluster assembly ATPase SufC
MDEIDAALDFRNVSIVANYIKDRTKNAQFIIISLRYDLLLALTSPFLSVCIEMICSSLATALLEFTRLPTKPEVCVAL